MKGARILLAALAALVVLVPALSSQEATIAEIVVSGLPESETGRIRALLPFAEGSSFASIEEARRIARFARAYLEQGEEFAGVEIEVEEVEEGEISVYVFPRPATIAGMRLFETTMTMIPNFPFYGLKTGFGIGDREQLLGFDLPLARGLSFDFAAGQSLSAEGDQALSGRAGISLKPLPLFSAYALAGIDSYFGPGGPWPTDAFAQVGAKLKLDFLSRLVLVGPSLEASYRRAFLDFPYAAARGKIVLGFEPFDFLGIEALACLYSISGTAPSLAGLKSAGTRELRLLPQVLPEGGGLASASITGRAGLPFSLSLGIMSLSFSLFGFFEASLPYSDLRALGALGTRPVESFARALGGGIILALSPPFSLFFEVGVGYSFARRETEFLFRLR
jgi:hypothetical protein